MLSKPSLNEHFNRSESIREEIVRNLFPDAPEWASKAEETQEVGIKTFS